jgi:hypothetical protein
MNPSELTLFQELHTWKGRESQEQILEFLQILTEKHQKPRSVKNLKNLLSNPPPQDTKLQTIYKTPFVSGDIVLAGTDTRKKHPLTHLHPIHFKKSYLQKLSRWETSATHEAIVSQHIWDHFQELGNPGTPTPLPLGASTYTYRSQLLTAKTLGSLSPVSLPLTPNQTPRQILLAREQKKHLLPLWDLLEKLNELIDTFHSGGFLHNDLHRENLMLELHSGEPHLIDFETSQEDERFQTPDWDSATREDKKLFLQESALLLLCLPEEELPPTPFKALVHSEIERNTNLRSLRKTLS